MNQADTDSHLVTLDPVTGVPTDIGADGVPKIRGLTADSSGRLLGLTGSAGAFLALIPCPPPHTTLTVNAAPNSGVAPLTTTFTYSEANDGARPISGVKITDDTCSPLTFSGGDTNGNGILDPGETWTYTCTHVFAAAGTFTSHIVATGVDTIANQAVPQSTAQATVTARVGAHTTLTVKANPSSGTLPLTTTYTYSEVNDGGDPISGVKITDDTCSPLKLTGGDANGNSILDVGETWTYACTRTIAAAGTIMSHVVARGTNTVDQLAAPDEQASAVVTVSGAAPPKPAPATSVLGVQKKKQPAIPVTGPRLPVLPLSLLGVGLLVAGAAMLRRSGVRGRISGH